MIINTKILSLLAVVVLSGVSLSSAQAVNQKVEDGKIEKRAQLEDKRVEKTCNQIEKVAARLERRIGDDGNKSKEKLELKVRELEANQLVRNNELEERRRMRNESRNAFYAELETKTGEDEIKKAAAIEFRGAVEAAIKARREAIDNAKETMNSEIEKAIGSRNSATETLRTDFEADVATAINKAKNSCQEDATSEDLKNVLAQLKSDVKAAQEEYKSQINETKKVQTTIHALRETRKAAVKKAIEDFKAAMKTAQENFRNAIEA